MFALKPIALAVSKIISDNLLPLLQQFLNHKTIFKIALVNCYVLKGALSVTIQSAYVRLV